jgi:hypothetical protein
VAYSTQTLTMDLDELTEEVAEIDAKDCQAQTSAKFVFARITQAFLYYIRCGMRQIYSMKFGGPE